MFAIFFGASQAGTAASLGPDVTKAKAAAEKANTIKIEEDIKQLKHREEASNRIKAATKTKLIKQFKRKKKRTN